MINLNGDSVQVVPGQNQLKNGDKGSLALRLDLDFTVDAEQVLDLQHLQSMNRFDLCQSLWVDAYESGAAVEVLFVSSGHRIVAKAGSQGWYTPISPNPIQIKFKSAGGGRVTIFLDNTAIPGSVWSAI